MQATVQVVELRLLVALENIDLRLDLRAVRRRTHTDCCANAVLRQGAANHPRVHLVPQEEEALEPDPLGVVLGAADTVALTPVGLFQLVPKVVAQVFPFRFGDIRRNRAMVTSLRDLKRAIANERITCSR